MISKKDKKFLLEVLNIDSDNYSIDELNDMLDDIIEELNDSIKNKLVGIRLIRNELEEFE